MQLSIIIPVYNAAATLDRCIESILARRMQDFEILLIDDGSSDESPELCDALALKDSRIKVIHQENAGVSAARNKGLDQAKGDWICFIDADDSVEGTYFPLDLQDENDMYLQNELLGGEDLYRKWHVPNGGEVLSTADFLPKYAHTNLFRGVCSKFCKRSLIQKNGIRFDTHQRVGEDTLFFMDYIRYTHQIAIVETGIYIVESLPDKEWFRKYNYSRREAYDFFDAFLRRYPKLPVLAPKLAQIIYDIFEPLANQDELIPWSWKLNPSTVKIKRLQGPIRNWRFRLLCDIELVLSFFYPQ